MQKIEAIKSKRQAQHIYERWKKAKEIEKQKDIKEVQRDMALIRSPAAGLKRPAKEMEVDGEEMVEEALDTVLRVAESARKKIAAKKMRSKAKVVEEVHESDQEMEAY